MYYYFCNTRMRRDSATGLAVVVFPGENLEEYQATKNDKHVHITDSFAAFGCPRIFK